MSAVKKDQSPKLRIKLKSYDVRMLESSVSKAAKLPQTGTSSDWAMTLLGTVLAFLGLAGSKKKEQ